MLISPVFLYLFLGEKRQNAGLGHVLGLKATGLVPAVAVSLLLTAVLFLGPLCAQGLAGLRRLCTEPLVQAANLQNLIWLRNHVVAPLSEEFTFRACMLPLLLQCFRPMTAVFVCPLFFGVAHFHHMVERMKNGLDFRRALIVSCFQFMYTTMFGAYSAFLFVRTGHFAAPLTAHIFCNHMGFPDFAEILTYKDPRRACLVCLFVLGLAAWCLLLVPLTNPAWFGNQLHWRK
ncbi:CAAX prenyl protease 2 isoform X2 [Bacillus rossius redtenbacheri]